MSTQGKFFICDHLGCERIFKAKYSLMRHVKTKHLKKKKFECKHCGKKFALQHNLKEHEYIHTQALPFICGIDGCTQSFRQRGKLCLHRCKHPSYKKRSYKKNSELNDESKEESTTTPGQMIGLGYPNDNFEMRGDANQRSNYNLMNGMGMNNYQSRPQMSNSYQIGQQIRSSYNFNNYSGMMNLDLQSNMQCSQHQAPAHQSNTIPMRNLMSRPEVLNLGLTQPNQKFEYESGNSDEESKEEFNKLEEDELFLHPYSSMYRKEGSANSQPPGAVDMSRAKPLNLTFKGNDPI